MHPPHTPRLWLDVSVSHCPCAVPNCPRVTPPGETLYMRDIPGMPHCSEPLCEVHGAEAQADTKLKIRVWLHAVNDQRATAALAKECRPPPPDGYVSATDPGPTRTGMPG